MIHTAIIQENALNIFTDGSSLGRPRAGGIGIRFVVIDSAGKEIIQDFDFDGYPNATNNQMELNACIMALKEAQKQNLSCNVSRVIINTDSLYVVDNYKKAMFQWPKTKWLLNSGRPVLNPKLWKELVKCISKAGMPVEIKWIKGHSKDIHNKAVDKLAKKSAKQPFGKSLKHINLRRKKTKKSVEVGCVKMEGQKITIHIISSEYLSVQYLWKYKYEVMSKKSQYYQNVDIIFSDKERFMGTGRTYYVKVNNEIKNPRIEKVYREIK